MLKEAKEIISFNTRFCAIVLSPLCFDYRNCVDYMSISHDETHMNSYKEPKC